MKGKTFKPMDFTSDDYTPLVGDGPIYDILPHANADAPVECLKAHLHEDGSVLLVVDGRCGAPFPDAITAGAAAYLIEAALVTQRQAMAH